MFSPANSPSIVLKRLATWLGPLLFSLFVLAGSPQTTQAQASEEAVLEAMLSYLSEHPQDVVHRRQLADRLLGEGRVNEAITHLEQIRSLTPNDLATLQQLAELYDWTNQPEKALSTYELILRFRPNDAQLRREVVRRHIWLNQVEESIQHLEILSRQQPDSLGIKNELAQQYLWTNQEDQARALLKEILVTTPEDQTARRLLANLYFWNDRPEGGIEQLELLVDYYPEDLDTRDRLARHYFWNNQPEKGIQQFELILEQDPTLDSLRYEAAQYYFHTGQDENGLQHLEALVDRTPKDPSLRRELAQRYLWANRIEDNVRQLEYLLIEAPTDTLRWTLAERLFWLNRPERGLQHLEILLQQHPSHRDLRTTLATRYTEHGNLDEAIEQYQWLVEHPPTTAEVKDRFLQFLLWEQRYEDVVSFGSEMLATEPHHVERRLKVAQALAWTNQPQAAVAHVDTLLRDDPNHFEALLLGGELQRWMPAQWPEAHDKLQRVRAQDPDNEQATTLLRGLRQEHGSVVETSIRYETDSNELTHEYAPVRANLWLGGKWRALVEVGTHRFRDGRVLSSASPLLYAYEGTAGLETELTTRTTVQLLGTATMYGDQWTSLGGSVLLRHPFGPVTVEVMYERGEAQESVLSLRSQIRAHRLEGRIDLTLWDRLTLSGQGMHAWYSDDNIRVMANGSAYFVLLRNNPTLAVWASYQHDNSWNYYPDSRPYWTPILLSTYSSALSVDVPVLSWLQTGASYGLSEQEGSLGHNYGVRLQASPGDFHTLQASLERSGSDEFSHRTVSFQYSYRF